MISEIWWKSILLEDFVFKPVGRPEIFIFKKDYFIKSPTSFLPHYNQYIL